MLSASEGPVVYFSEFVEGRRGQILDAALGVFAVSGYEGGTMREIAAAVGVSEPAIYRHYAGKEAIFEELVALAGDRIVGTFREVTAEIRPDNLRESLRALIETRRVAARESEIPIIRMLLTAAPHSDVFTSTFREHFAGPMAGMLGALVPRLDSHFGLSFTPTETADRVRAFMSQFLGHFMTSMILGSTPSEEATIDAMLAIMGWSA